ncbi:hypothetical protein FQZ97_778260 [compost metagenome]
MTLGNENLVEDELQIAADDVHARAGDIGFLRQGRRWRDHHGTIHRRGSGRVDILQHPVGILVYGAYP